MLTNEANFVLHHFYKIYKDRLDDGYSEKTARYFYDDRKLHHDYFLGFSFDDFITHIKEISSHKYVSLGTCDGGFAELIINPKAIIEMENLYKNNAKNFFNALIDIKKMAGV
ncbi:hypothetical protein ACA109_02570 [Staphylococcus aureus]|nr:hypothetical protein [Staphylococcus aureus]HDA2515615.1 hypothetical protein [Staphylococcus aureus]HDJ1601776.1 hypothetical protein [Staphylococcus aureus]HDJ2664039.1 hypothetical protein [Staphylococcus aureus]HEI4303608.1 hypothetical protein [Staphylococcus aureus]